jgi:hypothetical protein
VGLKCLNRGADAAGVRRAWRFGERCRMRRDAFLKFRDRRSQAMDLHQLEIFLTVLEMNGVTRAAQKVDLTPGAVSIQIQKLSNEVHAQLFIRGHFISRRA